ncbi:hypothetical protein KP509_35G013400 [Ceratopteris richardii]|uniref:LIM zinc-binding domain-containing protein n=1 Tax=Ceratopteris richardii TaxID=49495 RepID=A0A8T2QEW4_CERRI|nr:hypothetical protein KP509_35G013400 [Ceratopteris richardii]
MAFLGAHARCKSCGKRVFFTEQIKTPEGDAYHRGCFRCNQCRKNLEVDNYASVGVLLYCKPHFEQLSSKSPSTEALADLDQAVPPTEIPKPILEEERPATPPRNPAILKLQSDLPKAPNKATSFKFIGTQEKCVTCSKTVYPLEKVSVEGSSYHKSCFKCLQGGCSISPANYAAMEGRLYCKHHFKQLFKEKGNYSQLLVKLPSARIP